MSEEEKLYFTEITETEKQLINLVRGFVAPYDSPSSFLDFVVDAIVHKILDETIRAQAFIDVMQHERDNKELSNTELFSRLTHFENFIHADKDRVASYVSMIYGDIASTCTGDILPIESYCKADNIKETEKRLDKMVEN